MSDLPSVPTQELLDELVNRQAIPKCPCGKWPTYIGAYDEDGWTYRCKGCLRAIARCTCIRLVR